MSPGGRASVGGRTVQRDQRRIQHSYRYLLTRSLITRTGSGFDKLESSTSSGMDKREVLIRRIFMIRSCTSKSLLPLLSILFLYP